MRSTSPKTPLLLLALLLGAALAPVVLAAPPVWDGLEGRLVEKGFPPAYVRRLLTDPVLEYEPAVMARKMDALVETLRGRRAGEKAPVPHEERAELYESYTADPELVERSAAFMRSRAELLGRVEERYGVPREIMTALLLVESKLGSEPGRIRVFVNLASMAASRDDALFAHRMRNEVAPGEREWFERRMNDKADWALEQLAALLRYAQAAGQDPLEIRGSVYGAIGYCQFIPTSAEAYGVDGDGDGVVDLFTEADAVASIGNYLRHHGWKGEMTKRRKWDAIFAYNHSIHYTRTILAVAKLLEKHPR